MNLMPSQKLYNDSPSLSSFLRNYICGSECNVEYISKMPKTIKFYGHSDIKLFINPILLGCCFKNQIFNKSRDVLK